MIKVRYLVTLVIISATALSCAGIIAKPYGDKTHSMISYYKQSNFKSALFEANKLLLKDKNAGKDLYLTLLERGKIALANGDYNSAIKDLQEAERRFLRIEGTLSINEEVGSFFSNDLNSEYETDPYETILISPYLAISYLQKGDFNGARVERNRTINKINEYIKSYDKKHLENPFARYIAALIYEMEGKYQDALIEYRQIFGRGFVLPKKKKKTQLVIIIDTGLAPYKYEAVFGPVSFKIQKKVVVIRFAYPKMKRTTSNIDSFIIHDSDGNRIASTKMLYNLENTMMTHFEKTKATRQKRIFNKFVARLALSLGGQAIGEEVGGNAGGIISFLSFIAGTAGSFMDKADLRQWKTLPKNIQYARLRDVKPGKQSFLIRYNGGHKLTKELDIKEDKINIVYMAVPG